MKATFKTVVLTLCLLLNTLFSSGNNVNSNIDYILVVNAYADTNPWSNSLINPIIELASRKSNIGIYPAHLRMLTLQDAAALKEFEEKICNELSTRTPASSYS